MLKPAGLLFTLSMTALLAAGGPALASTRAASGGAAADNTATPMPAGPPPVPDSPAGDKNTPQPPTMPDMTAFVLMDATTGAILAEAAPNLTLPPASLAKLMTAHLTYQALQGGTLQLSQTVPVSAAAWHAGGSTMFIDTTSVVTVDQLLHGLIIDSGNDAAVALAQQVAGSQGSFVQLMNREAATLGLTNTVYTNVDGLPDPAQHTSAMDVALLTRAILKDEPQILNISKQPSYTYNNITQPTWNPVLAHDPTVDGLKTGLTNAAGHCIDATALRGGRRLIAVVTGGPTWHASTAAIEALLDYGQKFSTDVTIATPGQPIATLASQALDSGSAQVGAANSLTVTLPTDAAGAVTHAITYTADLTPGVTKGEILGTVTYTANGKTLGTSPVVALADSPPASFMTKLKRKLRSML